MFTEFDRLAMTRALALAERGLETTHPNPRVGCVIAKGDRIIAEGWHERAGEAHAEVAALRAAKEPVAGATAYVTLEPCSHHGRTPPCVNALIEARIGRVVFAVQDPNPRVSGQGADALLRAGITVEAGLMQAEATELNIGFMKRMREGLPWVRVKLAMSLDGRTALANGASQWITGEAARADVQRWRARCSAVLTGVGTVIADDPQLNVRAAGFKGRQPLRVVLDARLRSPGGAKMFVGLASGAAAGGAAGPSSGVRPVAAVSASGPGGVSSAGVGVGGAATVRAGGAAASGGTAAIAGLPVAVGGEVLIFTAVGGGLSAAGPARSAGPVDPSALADDLAELVNAFETSPTSVAARSAEMAGPVSVRTEAPGAAAAAFGPGGSAAGAHPAGAGAAASRAVSASGADVAAGQGSGAAGATSSVSATASSVPPILAAATSALGAASTADDATWAGAALSGAIPVKTDVKSPPDDGKESALVGAAVGGISAGAVVPTASVAPSDSSAGAPAFVVSPAAPGVAVGGVAPGGATAVPGTTAGMTVAGSGANAVGAPVTPTSVTASAGSAPGSVAASAGAPQQGAAATRAARPDTPAAFQARRAALLARGVRIEEVAADDGFLDLFAVLKRLGELDVNEVLVEAGPTLAGQLLTTFLVDELLLYIAPKLLGPQGRPLVNLPELQSLQDALGFALFDAKRFGDDLRLRMRPK